MAGGPIYPSSAYPNDSAGRLFPNFYVGTNQGGSANASPVDEGLGVEASLDADAAWELRFPIPPTVPSGTLKLRVLSLANATSGVLKFTVSDGHCAAGSVPSGVTLTSETQSSVTWAAGSNDKYMETKVTLSTTPSGNDMLIVAITFNTTGTTLAVVSTHLVSIIWE